MDPRLTDWTHCARSSLAIVALLTLLPLLPLAGCGGGSRIMVPPLQPEEVARFRAAANDPKGSYRIEPGDTLGIRLPFHPEMDQQALVRPDGRITANIVGDLDVAGLTTTEIEERLGQGMSDHLRDPQIEVTIARFSPKYVYVTGEVGKPGLVEYRDGLTPFQAVIDAGGFRDTALTSSVILVRSAASEKDFMTRRLNLDQSLRSGLSEPLLLAPHDVVYVPTTAIADADIWVEQHVTKLLPFLRGAGASFPLGF